MDGSLSKALCGRWGRGVPGNSWALKLWDCWQMAGSSSSTNRTAALWLLSKNNRSHLPLVGVLEVGSMPSNSLVAMIISLREDAWGGDTGLSITVKEMPEQQ